MVFMILVRCSVHGALCREELTAEPYVDPHGVLEKSDEHRAGGDKGSLPSPSDSVGSTVVSFYVLWASVVLTGLAVRYPVRIQAPQLSHPGEPPNSLPNLGEWFLF